MSIPYILQILETALANADANLGRLSAEVERLTQENEGLRAAAEDGPR